MSEDSTSSTPSMSGHGGANKRPSKKTPRRKKVFAEPDEAVENDVEDTEEKATARLLDYLQDLTAQKEKDREKRLQRELDKTYLRDTKETTRLLEYAEHVLTEVYEDFLVIGHTHDGKTNLIISAETDRDKESLTEALRRYMTSNDFPII